MSTTTRTIRRRLAATAASALALGLLAVPAAAGAATGFTTPRPTPPPPVGADDVVALRPLLSIELDDAEEYDPDMQGRLVLSSPLDQDLHTWVGVQFPDADEFDVNCPDLEPGFWCPWDFAVDIPAGVTEVPFELELLDDQTVEDAEVLRVGIDGVLPDTAVRIGPAAEAVIYDGDGLHLSLVDDAPEGIEGDPGSDGTLDLVVEADQALPHPVTFRAYSVIVGFGATPGADYQPIDLIAELPAGETTTTVSVPLVGDDIDESPYEIFMAHIGEPSHGEVHLNGGTTVPRIMDDDGPKAVFDTPDGYQSPSRSARSAALTA